MPTSDCAAVTARKRYKLYQNKQRDLIMGCGCES